MRLARKKSDATIPGMSGGFWKAMKMPFLLLWSAVRDRRSSPSSSAEPDVMRYSGEPMRTFRSVDLPCPLGPSSARQSPFSRVRLRSFRISFPPASADRLDTMSFSIFNL